MHDFRIYTAAAVCVSEISGRMRIIARIRSIFRICTAPAAVNNDRSLKKRNTQMQVKSSLVAFLFAFQDSCYVLQSSLQTETQWIYRNLGFAPPPPP